MIYTLNLSFYAGDLKTKDFELNDNKHSLNFICCYFIRQCNFSVLV